MIQIETGLRDACELIHYARTHFPNWLKYSQTNLNPSFGKVFKYRVDADEEARIRLKQDQNRSTIKDATQQKDDIRDKIRQARSDQQQLQLERSAIRKASQNRKAAENKIARKQKKLREIESELSQVDSDRDIASIKEKIANVQQK